jgi:thioredoxin
MKQLFVLIALFAIVFPACGNKNIATIKNTTPTVSTAESAAVAGHELLTKASFLQKVWNYTQSPNTWKYLGNKPAIVDFYADWCGPCRIASPILDEIGKEYSGKIQVYKINTDQEKELAQVFGITGIPAFLYIPMNGKPVMMSGIARTNEETKQMFVDNIEKILSVKK